MLLTKLPVFQNRQKFLFPIFHTFKEQFSVKGEPICKEPYVFPNIVTLLDVISSDVGQYVALLLKQSPLIKELRLYDKSSSVFAMAEDLSHVDTRAKIKSFGGKGSLVHAIKGTGIVVSLGGCKKVPGEDPVCMFERNIDEVRTPGLYLTEFNPKAIYCIAKPPIEALVPLVSAEYAKSGVYDARRIIGITTPASMRASYFIGKTTGQDPTTILCPIIGGFSEKTTVAVLSQVRPKINIESKNFSILQDCIAYGEDDVLNLYDCERTVCITTATGIARFVNNLLKALKGEHNCVDCAFVRQSGQIGEFLTYMTSIVRLGPNGIESSHMPKINEEEATRLKNAAVFIRQNIRMGENYGLRTDDIKERCLDYLNKCERTETKPKNMEKNIKNESINKKPE